MAIFWKPPLPPEAQASPLPQCIVIDPLLCNNFVNSLGSGLLGELIEVLGVLQSPRVLESKCGIGMHWQHLATMFGALLKKSLR